MTASVRSLPCVGPDGQRYASVLLAAKLNDIPIWELVSWVRTGVNGWRLVRAESRKG